MKLLETPHQRKSAVLTSIIGILLLLLLFVLGLTYYDPPISFGMEVNFGNSQTGSGKIQPTQPVAAKPKPIQRKPVVEKQVNTPPPTTTKVNQKVVTQKENNSYTQKRVSPRTKTRKTEDCKINPAGFTEYV